MPLTRSPPTGVLRKSHRYLDGRVSVVRVLGPAGVCCCQLHRPPTQGAAALQTEATTHEGEYSLTSVTHLHPRLFLKTHLGSTNLTDVLFLSQTFLMKLSDSTNPESSYWPFLICRLAVKKKE